MKQRKLKVAKELRELLSNSELEVFTLIELRDSFEDRFGLGDCSSKSELRMWIHRRILPLVKRGYLSKNRDSENKTAVYRVSELFIEEYRHSRHTSEHNSSKELIAESSQSAPLSVLKAKRSQYQVDMLSCAGECKEYQQLATEYPSLRNQIEPMFRSARERSSELMGQLKAINNILKQAGLSE